MVFLALTAASCLFTVEVVFQIGLAAGAPWGRAAWGGRQPAVLPQRLHIASGASALVLGLAGLAQAGAFGIAPPPVLRWVIGGFAGFLALNTLGNFVSPSREERWVMGPVSLLLSISCGAVAWLS